MARSRTRQRRTRQRRTKQRTNRQTKQWTKQRTKPLRNNQRVKQRKTRRRTRGGRGGQPSSKTRSPAAQRRASAAAFHLAQAGELEAQRGERVKAAAKGTGSGSAGSYQPKLWEQSCQSNHKSRRKGCCGPQRYVIHYDARGNYNPNGWLTDFDTKEDYDAHQETLRKREAARRQRRGSDSSELSPLQQPDLTRMEPEPQQHSPPWSPKGDSPEGVHGSLRPQSPPARGGTPSPKGRRVKLMQPPTGPLRSTTPPQKHPPRASHPGTAGTRSPRRRAGTPPPRR